MHEPKRETAIRMTGVRKQYRLGQIGGGTLQGELQSWWARVRGREDPNARIGAPEHRRSQTFMALRGIDLTVFKGETLGIIGGNGAGKSTLLKLLCRVTAPTAGEIDIDGRIASMLEVGTGFSGEMTGRENIYLNGAILGMTRAEIDAKMEQIIDFSEVREFIDTPVKRYSSGMYVKLAFAVAAHLDSEILIMDEVLAVGDVAFQKKCLARMRDAARLQGRTVLYVSHNMNTIRQLCGRCIVLDQGRIVFDGEPERAIEVYLGTTCAAQSRYVYDAGYHTWKMSRGRFRLESLELPGRDASPLASGDVLTLLIRGRSAERFDRLKLRLELQYQDGTRVGTMLAHNAVRVEADSSVTLRAEMDTSHLTPGRYRADLIAYIDNELGREEFLDGVYPGLVFDVGERVDESNPLVWLHGPWGHIHLHDLRIEQCDP